MSFQQGLSGLNAAARNLDAIGNNVANASTVGFKSSGLIFADVYANSLRARACRRPSASAPQLPRCRATSGRATCAAPAIRSTSRSTASGFFRMDTNGSITYSRNGQFHLDKDGFIVNATGAKVTGYGVDAAGNILVSNPQPLQVSSAQLAATATTTGEIGLNLDAREAIPVTAPFNINNAQTYNKATSLTVFDSLGNSHSLSTYYVKTAARIPGRCTPPSTGLRWRRRSER